MRSRETSLEAQNKPIGKLSVVEKVLLFTSIMTLAFAAYALLDSFISL